MSPEEPTDLDVALSAADAGNAGHWPTVASILAAEVRRQRELLEAIRLPGHEETDEWAVEVYDLMGERVKEMGLNEEVALERFFALKKSDEGMSELSAWKPKLLHRSIGPWVECTKDHWEKKG